MRMARTVIDHRQSTRLNNCLEHISTQTLRVSEKTGPHLSGSYSNRRIGGQKGNQKKKEKKKLAGTPQSSYQA